MITKPILLAVVTAAALSAQQPPNGDEIIRKSMEAQGGEKLKAVKTIQFTGKAYIGGQVEAPVVYRAKRPLRYRTELQITGHPMTEGFDGAVKWISDGITPSKASEETSKTAADNADPIGSPLFNYRDKGNTVEFAGREKNEGQDCYKFNVKLKSGNTGMVYIDQKSYLTFKIITKAGSLEAESKLNDYRKVDQVLIPFANFIRINGQDVMMFKYDKAELNVPMDDALFTIPAKK